MKLITLRLDDDLHQKATLKCKQKFNITLSSLIKVFLSSFASQRGVGFYIGDDDICQLFARWLRMKRDLITNPNGFKVNPPRLKDLYELGNKKTRTRFDI